MVASSWEPGGARLSVKYQQNSNGMWCLRNTHMHTISPWFCLLNKAKTLYSWLKCFLNKIILIPTHESAACIFLTWFPPTSLIRSISWLPPQLHTPITYATTCSWVVVSCQTICEKKKHLFPTQYCLFRNHFLESRSLSWIIRTCLVFFLSTLSWFITIHN